MQDSPLKEAFRRFKKSRFSTPVAFIVVLILDVLLLHIYIYSPTDACLSGILMGLISVFGFVWLGVKEPRKILVMVTVLFLILSPVFAYSYTNALYSIEYPDHIDPERFVVSEVSVEPYLGDSSRTAFNFTAVVPGDADNISITLKIVDGTDIKKVYFENEMLRLNGTDNGTDNETVFYYETYLERGTYVFMVIVYENGELVDGTDMFYFYGPQNMEKSDYFTVSLPYSFIRIFLQIGGLTYILVGMYWWTLIARDRRRSALTVTKEEGDMTKCPICEHKIPYGTRTCPYCGAELEYSDDEKAPEDGDKEDDGSEGSEEEEKAEN